MQHTETELNPELEFIAETARKTCFVWIESVIETTDTSILDFAFQKFNEMYSGLTGRLLRIDMYVSPSNKAAY
jgi:hypothetical protein